MHPGPDCLTQIILSIECKTWQVMFNEARMQKLKVVKDQRPNLLRTPSIASSYDI